MQTGAKNLATSESIKKIEKLVDDEIRREIDLSLKKAKELDTDIFGFGDIVHKFSLNDYEHMKNEWGEIFSEITLESEISSNIRSNGVITEPALTETEDSKNERKQ